MLFWLIACLIHSGTRFSGQKWILGAKNKVHRKIWTKLWIFGRKQIDFFLIFLGSPGVVPLLRASPDQNKSILRKNIWYFLRFFLRWKHRFFTKARPGTRESRVRCGGPLAWIFSSDRLLGWWVRAVLLRQDNDRAGVREC